MAFSFATNTGVSIGTTEYSIIAASTTLPTETTDEIDQAIVWFQNLAAGDVYRVRVYESDGTTKRCCYEGFVSNAQSCPGYIVPSLVLGVGYDITVTKVAGTDRSIGWTIATVT